MSSPGSIDLFEHSCKSPFFGRPMVINHKYGSFPSHGPDIIILIIRAFIRECGVLVGFGASGDYVVGKCLVTVFTDSRISRPSV